MEQEYESKRWRAFTNGRKDDGSFIMRLYDFPGDSLPEEKRMSAMGYFLNNGSPHYFTVLPQMDLFFLQADGRELDLIKLYSLEYGHGLWSPNVGLAGPKHVAIEFDPKWYARIETDERYEEGLAKILDEERRREIFEGADRRFVEVAAGWHQDVTNIHDDFETDSGCLEFY
ncbi:hypothetical protein NW754_010885 [Fusarium falciforme]|nr:hypothetical protein NW754_010885 [Fusarium falciforme]